MQDQLNNIPSFAQTLPDWQRIEHSADPLLDPLAVSAYSTRFARVVTRVRVRHDTLKKAAEVGRLLESCIRLDLIPEGVPGIVYVMTDASGFYKIGYTTNIVKRYTKAKVDNPTLCVVAFFSAHNVLFVERVLHGVFEHLHVGGEWFDLAGVRP